MLRHLTFGTLVLAAAPALSQGIEGISYGPRPFYLIDRMAEGPLKERLLSCAGQTPRTTRFSIGHRGAPLQFPEHTVESNLAAARMGAGILECDVTFTKDLELVCRHAQNDLHTTTNILATPLAETCITPFTPATGDEPAKAECRTSEITLEEFRTLTPKMDAADRTATTVEAYMRGTPDWRTELYAAEPATLMTHAESIELFRSLGAKFTPELKAPAVEMPFNGFTQQDYAQKLVDEYKAAGIPPSDVWLQSFNLDDILYWIENEPEFGAQAVYLMDEYNIEGYSPMDPATWPHSMEELKAMGVNYIAPPTWMLVTLEEGRIVPSELARRAKAAGLKIITWTLERSGPLVEGGGWYYQSIGDVVNSDGMMYELIDVLAQDVGVEGIFSDWPATVTYYANCMGLD
ncbi:glycerophosphoryl diester phosphodiesterase [Meinhardsimonia xiamenensis]|jgi:glycerophosphoryl diester phosphodiesterase|uniref:glycerophosphodiester phosphodiesterase n=1 Tax=Meinhardsimonia xiamenensis TaxID=990712 RepID=A0A1G8YD51_9RHOB|nr:glycerophosphodiester phosphodiesterase family protein [Meinhardsimonia xiamenensis]PRX37240.1 glycerophosphoryl diester phosphodiesterase [Meinhardsimonia xiamenensis]SDK00155.1 glycerophosphoryl diester phosphodiesterase [Meinhardsimonia xiamenensis]